MECGFEKLSAALELFSSLPPKGVKGMLLPIR